MSGAVTLKDIALAVGVSAMTVSRALRKDPSVSVALGLKIQQAAEQLNYRPNPLVSALMSTRRTRRQERRDLTLGFITAFPTRAGWRRERLYTEFFHGAEQGAGRRGYRLEEFWAVEPGMSPRRLNQVLQTRGVSGLLLAPLPDAQGRLELEWEHFCAVAFGYSLLTPPLNRVSNHQFRSMRLLLARLRELGYHRPGLALAQGLDERVMRQWLGGFLAEQESQASRENAVLLFPDEVRGRERFFVWLKSHRPDVVIGHQAATLEWIRECGHRVPQDIGFAHLDCPKPNGDLSGVCQNGFDIGVAAAEMLVSMLERNETGVPLIPRTLVMEGSWCEGATTPRRESAVSV